MTITANNMHNDSDVNHTDEEPVSVTVTTIHQVCSTFLSISGSILNLMTMIAIIKSRLYRQTAIAIVLNFVVINFLVAAVCLPTIMVTSFATSFVKTHIKGCQAGGYIIYGTIGTELMALLLIAFNRYFLIVHFQHYQKIYSRRKIVITMVISWVIYPVIFLFPITETWGHFTYDIHRFACHPMNSNDRFGTFIIIFVLVTTLPCLVYSYFAIVYKVVRNRRKINATRTNSKEGYNKNEMQLVITVILILTTFAILYIPFLVLGLLDPHMTKYGVVIHVVSIYFGWSHVVVNPLIYSVMNRQIKQAYAKLMCIVKRKTREVTNALHIQTVSSNGKMSMSRNDPMVVVKVRSSSGSKRSS